MTFLINAQLDLTAEESDLFAKYKLHERVVYNSDAFLQHVHQAEHHREEADKEGQDLPTILYNSFAEVGHNIMGRLSLQLTLQNLTDGIQIESHDLEEILNVERSIHASVQFLADYLNVAVTFDSRETLDEY